MKRIVLLLLAPFFCLAQTVSIPDANFKMRLLSASPVNTTAYAGGVAVKIDTNNDYQIQVSEAAVIDSLRVNSANIQDLTGISAFTNLKKLDCSQNALSSLDVSSLTNLKKLSCNSNVLTSLNVAGLSSLKELWCAGNSLGTVNTAGLSSLEYFSCSDSGITSLDLTGLDSLYELDCDNNQLTALDVSVVPNLYALLCQYNPLTTVDFSASVGLGDLYINDTPIANLVVSNCLNLTSIEFGNNPLLESVNIKNGAPIQSINFAYLPMLASFCADESEIELIQSKMDAAEITGVPVSSYCSFHPGGAYNTISGIVRLDSDNDGCGDADINLSNVKITINDGETQGATFTDANGSYILYTQEGNQTLTASMENPEYFTISPAVDIHFDDDNFHTATADFCITAAGAHPDVEIVLVPIEPARPGFDAKYALTFKNRGNQTMNGTVTLQFLDSMLDFVSSSEAPDVQSGNLLSWNYANLLPFETRTIDVTLNVNSPMETPAVNIGDELNFSATVTPVAGDETPQDNAFGLKQIVVGSFDPNDKHCLQGSIVSPTQIGNYLHYVINFENTGNFPAENVVIKDMIDTDKFDISSLQVVGASHSEIPVVTGGKLEFFFEGINLQPNAYGYVAIKIKTNPGLSQGDTVTNKANIYFDFNIPVETNIASTTFQSLGTDEQAFDRSVRIFPNPAANLLNVQSNSIIRKVSVFDVQGRLVWSDVVDADHATVDVSRLSPGIYLLKTDTGKGKQIRRFIKE